MSNPAPSPAPAAGQQPAGAALIRAILACGGFVPETRAELLRIAEVLEIADAMDSLAPAPASDEMAHQAEPYRLGWQAGHDAAEQDARRRRDAHMDELMLRGRNALRHLAAGEVIEARRALNSMQPPTPEPDLAEAAWSTAESAPRDGSHILVAQFNGGTGFGVCGGVRQPWQAVVHYWANPGEEGFYLSSGDSGGPPVSFTHWRPLDLSPDATLAREVPRG